MLLLDTLLCVCVYYKTCSIGKVFAWIKQQQLRTFPTICISKSKIVYTMYTKNSILATSFTLHLINKEIASHPRAAGLPQSVLWGLVSARQGVSLEERVRPWVSIIKEGTRKIFCQIFWYSYGFYRYLMFSMLWAVTSDTNRVG